MGKIKTCYLNHPFFFNFIKSCIGLVVLYSLLILENKKVVSFGLFHMITFPIILVALWKVSSFPLFNQKNMFLKFAISLLIALIYNVIFTLSSIFVMVISEYFLFIPMVLYSIIDYISNLSFSRPKFNMLWSAIFIGVGAMCFLLSKAPYWQDFFLLQDKYYSYMDKFIETFYWTFFLTQSILLNICYFYQFKS